MAAVVGDWRHGRVPVEWLKESTYNRFVNNTSPSLSL